MSSAKRWPLCTGDGKLILGLYVLTHWGRDKMATIFQTTFSNAFPWMKMYEFRSKFHWVLFPGVQLTIFQHWFVYWRIYASFGLNELTTSTRTLKGLMRCWNASQLNRYPSHVSHALNWPNFLGCPQHQRVIVLWQQITANYGSCTLPDALREITSDVRAPSCWTEMNIMSLHRYSR